MPDPPQPRIRLGEEVPAPIREFVACTRDELELDASDTSWLPTPPGLGEYLPDPTITFTPGDAPSSGTVSLEYPLASATFGVAIVDGKLEVDPSGLGPLADAVSEPLERFVRDLNAQLADNGKEFGPATFADGKLTARKQAVGAAEEEPAPATPPPVVAPPPTEGTTPPPDEGEGDEDEPPNGCLKWLIGGVVVLLGAAGIAYVATQGGDDDETADVATEEPSSSTSSSSTSEAPDEQPPAGSDDPDDGTEVSQLDCDTDAQPTGTTEVAGQDPRATLQGAIPFTDPSGQLYLVLCTGAPWGPEGPVDLFSFYVQSVLDPGDGRPGGAIWQVHEGVFTAQVAGPDAPPTYQVFLTDQGMPALPTGRTTAGLPPTVPTLYESGSWTSEGGPPAVFDEGTFPLDLDGAPEVDAASLTPLEGGGATLDPAG